MARRNILRLPILTSFAQFYLLNFTFMGAAVALMGGVIQKMSPLLKEQTAQGLYFFFLLTSF